MFFLKCDFAQRRSRHMPSFFAENPRVKWQRGRATPFPFSPKIRESKWQRGRATSFPFSPKIRESALVALRSRHTPSFFAQNPRVGTFARPPKGIPCAFPPQKAGAREQKRERNASAPGFRLHSSGTALPFYSETSV